MVEPYMHMADECLVIHRSTTLTPDNKMVSSPYDLNLYHQLSYVLTYVFYHVLHHYMQGRPYYFRIKEGAYYLWCALPLFLFRLSSLYNRIPSCITELHFWGLNLMCLFQFIIYYSFCFSK